MAIPYSRPIGDATALTFILHEPKEENPHNKSLIQIRATWLPQTALSQLNIHLALCVAELERRRYANDRHPFLMLF